MTIKKKVLVVCLLTGLLLGIFAEHPKENKAEASWTYGQVYGEISRASREFGQSYYWMVRVAQCESGLNPGAYNYSSGASGLYQYLYSTFWGNVWKLYWPRGTWISPYNPRVAARLTAYLWSRGLASMWTCAYIVGYLRSYYY